MRHLIELELVAVCSPDFPCVEPNPRLTQILTLPLIQDTHRRWDKLIGREVLSATSEPLNFNSASLAIDAAINMQGIAIVPSLFVQDDIADGRLKEIWRAVEPSGEYLFLIWPEEQIVSEPLNDVIRWIHDEFGHDAGNPM